MTKDNHLLGKFELSGIPPAPRGVPQIDVTFEVDANGILQVSAEDQGTGKREEITITAEKGRLSEEEIERMVREAEEFAESDKLLKDKIDARNGFESYIYQIKNALDDPEKGLKAKLSAEDASKVSDTLDEASDWLDENQEADAEDYNNKKEEMKGVLDPILKDVYQAGGADGGESEEDFYDDDDDDDFDDDHDEL